MKISPLTIFVWCVAIAMMALTYGLAKRDPIMAEVASYKKYRDGMIQEQKNWKKAVTKVQAATALAQGAVKQWNDISASQTLPAPPDPAGIDLSMDDEHLAEVIADYRNHLQEMVNNQVKSGGVTVVQGPIVPVPPTVGYQIVSEYFHYPEQSSPVLVFDLGSITVRGTFKQISDNVRAWSRMPHFLAVADGLRLQGTSPKLTGVYQVSIVGFVKVPSDKWIFPPMPDGAHLVSITPTAAGAPTTAQAQAALQAAVKNNPQAAAALQKGLAAGAKNPQTAAAAAQMQAALNQATAANKGGANKGATPPATAKGAPAKGAAAPAATAGKPPAGPAGNTSAAQPGVKSSGQARTGRGGAGG